MSDDKPWREWPEYRRAVKRADGWTEADAAAPIDDLCARVWREAQAAWIDEDDQRWIKVIEGRASRLEAAIERADRLAAALRRLVTMIDRHREIYGHEKAHYVIDENEEWRAARAALADSAKEVNDGSDHSDAGAE